MMMRGLMIGVALTALAACETGSGAARSFDDPAVQKLYNLRTPEYFATMQVASVVARNCARYSFDTALEFEVNEKRNEVGRGTLSANGLRDAIDMETDVTQRSFAAKHGVDLTGGDLCAAADAETAEGSALSALLAPA
ncbi:hypothetical protein ACJ5NV_08140 [Loktanella agnita]|uniref:hypothetical protein n=1 Tax=Loktanella agnita TaxID=287097 RepID=UPI003986AD95